MAAPCAPRRYRRVPCLVAAGLLGLCPGLSAIAADESAATGEFGLQVRWRAEFVDQDPLPHNALGIPLRLRLNYATGTWRGFSAFGEFDSVFDLGVDTYNEGGGNTPDRGDYPVIADPAGFDLNQAWLQYASEGGNRFRLGRQRITFDNQRFIGAVGWRQNEQTFDAVGFQRDDMAGFDVKLAWVQKVNRIIGRDVPAGEHDHDSWLLNLGHNFGKAGALVAYYYRLDDEDDPLSSNTSWGLRWSGGREWDGRKLSGHLEWAHQTEGSNNPVAYSADYWRADLDYALPRVTLLAGFESLGGDVAHAGRAFRTPLATLHGFNGWADKFLATPDPGLEDMFLGARGALGEWSWTVIYHDFNAESGNRGYGSEWDGSIGRRFAKRYGLLFKAARFDSADAAFGDTTKFWVQFTYDR